MMILIILAKQKLKIINYILFNVKNPDHRDELPSIIFQRLTFFRIFYFDTTSSDGLRKIKLIFFNIINNY